MRRLDKDFYLLPATELAEKLLGKIICRSAGDKIIRQRITETECYYGEQDSACHAYKGKTNRTKVMYEEGGVAYVYLCYGIHFLLNIVSGTSQHPEAVLIRGIEDACGPGRVTRLLQIDKAFNGEDLTASNRLWLEDDEHIPEFKQTPRIGISYAKPEDQEKLWRYVMINEKIN